MANQTADRVFDHGVIRDILTRRVYVGELAFGDTLSMEVAHPIIDASTFQMANLDSRRE